MVVIIQEVSYQKLTNMKLSKFKQLTDKLNKLSTEIWKQEPPKPFVMFWKHRHYSDEWHHDRFYSREDMEKTRDFIAGDINPKAFNFILTKELPTTTNP